MACPNQSIMFYSHLFHLIVWPKFCLSGSLALEEKEKNAQAEQTIFWYKYITYIQQIYIICTYLDCA